MRIAAAIPTTAQRRPELLAASIQSAESAKYDEILVSFDGPSSEAESLALRHPSATVLRVDGINMAENWANAVCSTTCDVVHFLCDDDEAMPDAARILRDYFDENPKSVLTFGLPTFGNYQVPKSQVHAHRTLDGEQATREILNHELHPGVISNSAFRRTSVCREDFDSTLSYTADLELYRRVLRRGELGVLGAPVAKSRRHGEQSSQGTPMIVRLVENAEVSRRAGAPQSYKNALSSWAYLITIEAAVTFKRVATGNRAELLAMKDLASDTARIPAAVAKAIRHLNGKSWRSATAGQ